MVELHFAQLFCQDKIKFMIYIPHLRLSVRLSRFHPLIPIPVYFWDKVDYALGHGSKHTMFDAIDSIVFAERSNEQNFRILF